MGMRLFDPNLILKNLDHIACPQFGTFAEFRFAIPENDAVINHEFGLATRLAHTHNLQQLDQLNVFFSF
jgi:hypothetical protein